MKLTYKELEIELELAGLLAVEELVLTQGLNCHAGLTLKILSEEEQRDELVTMSSDAGVTVRELEKTNGQVVFRGKLETVSARRENGLFYLYLEAWSYTMDWDRVKKSRSFQNGALTYMEVVQRVLSGYGQSGVTDHATGGACIPEFLLQYEESDWVFLRRLASHFGTYLLADATDACGKGDFPHFPARAHNGAYPSPSCSPAGQELCHKRSPGRQNTPFRRRPWHPQAGMF